MKTMSRFALRSAKKQLQDHLESGEVLLEFDVGRQADTKFPAPVIAVCSDRALYLLWGRDREVQTLPLAGLTAVGQSDPHTIVLGVRDAPDIWISFGRSPRPLFPVLRRQMLRLHVFESSLSFGSGDRTAAVFRPWRPGVQAWWRLNGPAEPNSLPPTVVLLAGLMELMRDASRMAATDDPSTIAGVTELLPDDLDEEQLNAAWAHRFEADAPVDMVLGDIVSESGRGRPARLIRTPESLNVVADSYSGIHQVVSLELARILDVEALPVTAGDPGRMLKIYYGPEELDRYESAIEAARSGDWTFVRLAVPRDAEGQAFILRLGEAVDQRSPFGAVVGTVVGR